MGAVWLVIRSELRHRRRSWLALVLLVSVVGGLVIAAAAAGWRTASAFPRFAATYGYDSFVYSYKPLPTLARLPEVTSVTGIDSPVTGNPTCRCPIPLTASNFTLFEYPWGALPHLSRLVSGRLPRSGASDEVLASFTFAHDEGIGVGTTIRVPLYAASQFAEAAAGTAAPSGPTAVLRVVGIEASESDFPSVGTPSYTVVATPAFARRYNARIVMSYGYTVRLRHGAADVPRFDTDVTAIGAAGTGDMSLLATTVSSTIHPQAVGWWVLALLAGVAGAAVVGQAMSRQSTVEAETNDTLAALGLTPRQLLAGGVARAAATGVVGAIGAVLVAYALSPLAPVGEARVADPAPGLAFDAVVLGLGALAVAVTAVLLGLWPAWRDSRLQRRAGAPTGPSSAVAGRLAAAGAPAAAVIGVRRALERGTGRNSVPVGSALAGTTVAVAALCATAVFGASLTHLTTSPRLYGQAFGVWFRNFPDAPSAQAAVARLRADRAVTAITVGLQGPATVDGVTTTVLAGDPIKGPLALVSSEGRLPTAPGEIALGRKTMRDAGAHIGSAVHLAVPLPGGATRTGTYRVVGTATFPPDFGIVGFDSGAVLSFEGYLDAQCRPGPTSAACRTAALQSPALLVGLRPGAAGRAAAARYAQQDPASAALPVKPTDLVNFGEAIDFPLILGVVLMLFGVATLVHVLVVSVARRRRELGLLMAVGFVRRQVAAAVCWQATTVALVGVLVGVPLGLVAGRLVWHAFALNLGVLPEAVMPAAGIALLAVGVVVASNLLAVGPAYVSARSRPGVLLRSE